jgi:hypothetical protein
MFDVDVRWFASVATREKEPIRPDGLYRWHLRILADPPTTAQLA